MNSRFLKQIFAKQKLQKARYFSIILIVSAIFLSIYTYFVITKNDNLFGPDPQSVMHLILLDLIVLLTLAIIISIELFKLWNNKKSVIQSSKIQTKIVLMFSLIASIPTIIVAISSTVFFYYGIQSWFNNRINTAFSESVEVAKAYMEEHQKLIEADALGLANSLNYLINYPDLNSKNLDSYLTKQAEDRTFIEAIIFQDNPFKIISQSKFSLSLKIDLLPKNALSEATNNIVIIKNIDKVQALIKLDNFPGNTFLLVGRLIDSRVLEHVAKTQQAYSEYKTLNSNISQMQIQFFIVFVIISLLLLLSAISTGIILASKIAKPIIALVAATEKIKSGNFSVRIEEGTQHDEIAILSRAFNLMTMQLDEQRNHLIEANKQIDSKRHFSETIISGVSAGIIALDINKKISMINPQAREILSLSDSDLTNIEIEKLCPNLKELLEQLEKNKQEFISDQIKITNKSKTSILFVKIMTEVFDTKALGYIITFDDITALIQAQRKAAWSDVARKIAHEIKNPLTPILLASQRLMKKYTSEVSDQKTFMKYIDTILKHVNQIAKMVEEFVYFARLPAPKFAEYDLAKIIRDLIFARECIGNNIQYIINISQEPLAIWCDGDQIFQALLNLVKNSEEAFDHTTYNEKKAIIEISLCKSGDYVIITVEDNGAGFPEELFDKLTEPYTTNKATGSGLGLAIVKKIIDDHNAIMEFTNKINGGTQVKLIFKQIQSEHNK